MNFKHVFDKLDKIEVEGREGRRLIYNEIAEFKKEVNLELSDLKKEFYLFKGKSMGVNMVMSILFAAVINIGIAIYSKPVDNGKTTTDKSKNLGR